MNINILNPYILRNNYFYEFAKLFVQNLLGCTTSGNQCKEVTRDDSDFFLENCLKLILLLRGIIFLKRLYAYMIPLKIVPPKLLFCERISFEDIPLTPLNFT